MLRLGHPVQLLSRLAQALEYGFRDFLWEALRQLLSDVVDRRRGTFQYLFNQVFRIGRWKHLEAVLLKCRRWTSLKW